MKRGAQEIKVDFTSKKDTYTEVGDVYRTEVRWRGSEVMDILDEKL